MKTYALCRYSSLVLLILCVCMVSMSGIANADRTTATPQRGGTVTLFGETYSVNGINFKTQNWPGTGPLDGTGVGGRDFSCGLGLGFAPGATEAQDRLLLTDECGAGGELGIILTGLSASPVYEPTVTVSTTSYIMNNTGNFGMDPSGIEWISDANLGATKTDINYRVVLGVNFHLVGYDASDFPMNEWSAGSPPGPWEVDWDQSGSYKGLAACLNGIGPAATRMYMGGVDEGPTPDHFAYRAFDLTTNSFVNNNSVYLDGIGTPDDTANPSRALRGLAFDGTYYYVMAKKPGASECWLYRYNSLPDPGVATGPHPDSSPLSDRLDTATGISFPLSDRGDRSGIACGRIHDNGKPVFYILCEYYLYTLVPQSPPSTPTPVPTPTTVPTASAGVGSWDLQR